MTSSSTTTPLQSLYKTLLRQAKKYPQYNYREYALRKIKEEFGAAKAISDPQELAKFMAKEEQTLEQLKRMVKVQELYCNDSEKLVVEKKN
jgi:hypothetical protein